jgi:hypothetical protein
MKRHVGFGTTSANERRNADLFYADLIGRPAPVRRALHPTESGEEEGILSDFMQPLGKVFISARGEFPGRPPWAPAGSSFMKIIAGNEAPANWQRREDDIAKQLVDGNFPDFLVKRWEPVIVKDDSGLSGRVWVMPDYLMIGNDHDYVYIPMSAPTAQRVADALKCVLPTAKLCHDIYRSASARLPRQERDYYLEGKQRTQRKWALKNAGQTSSAAYEEHSEAIKKQMRDLGLAPGTFVAGHKKDVIIAPGYPTNRVAFQGFYNDKGIPAEPCQEKGHLAADPKCTRPGTPTFAHERTFADYAQGARLVKATMTVDGEAAEMKVADVLKHDRYHKLLSPSRIDPARVPGASSNG